jgi:cell division protein FtsZ
MTHLQFDLPKEQSSIIKVIGVGGGGSNAVNHMYQQGIIGVNFVICNTDEQALHMSNIPNKIQLGPKLTQGLGAGSNPDCGKDATEESVEQIREILSKNTKMVFVTAGMGGGTGTGGAPVVARIAKEMGILTVGIVTTPFSFEGKRKYEQAIRGINNLREHVDTILIISNDKIREMFGNARQSEAFNHANNILATAAKSISEIITVPGYINVDFADVKYVMEKGGGAIMGCAAAEGENRAIKAVQGALNSPLLNDNDIRGAKRILVNISSGAEQVTIDEITEINEYIQEAARDTDIIFGTCDDPAMGDKISVTLIATGFEPSTKPDYVIPVKKNIIKLEDGNENITASVAAMPIVEQVVATPVVESVSQVYQLEDEPVVAEAITPVVVQEALPVHEEILGDSHVLSEDDEHQDLFTTLGTELDEDADNVVVFDFEQPKMVHEETEVHELVAETPVVVSPVYEETVFHAETVEPQAKEEEENYMIFNTKSYEAVEMNDPATAADDLTDRKRKLNSLSYRSMNKSNMTEMEQTPAYLRKGVTVEQSTPSTHTEISRFSLGVDLSGRPEISKNNTFLHDNVD